MKKPNLKIFKKIKLPIIVGLILILVILYEASIGYYNVYHKLNPQANLDNSNSIIRINRNLFLQASSYLDSLYKFVPEAPVLQDSNPFQY